MQEILIKPELLELVREGKKTTTCRFGKRNYSLTKTILRSNIDVENYSYINIKEIRYIKVFEITDETAKNDGFADKANLLSILKEIYGDIKDTDDITIVYFEFIE